MSTDLFKAILSMDAYNRGYGEGISNLGGEGSKIGNATILRQSDVASNTAGVSAGFYAIAYQDTDGAVTISYRGTDDKEKLTKLDLLNGWAIGLGDPNEEQAYLAFQFYKTAANANEPVSEKTASHERIAA